MKLVQHLCLLALVADVVVGFASPPARTLRPTTTAVSMGLFDGLMDYFSDEAKAKREEEKQRMIEEQEAAYREVLERRRNPEMMEEYMEERKERLRKFKGDDDASPSEEE